MILKNFAVCVTRVIIFSNTLGRILPSHLASKSQNADITGVR
ncbi:hypothetical protein THTE_3332 [Thermogutta terrifontis]|uniref:Uncharacterized protein n=1 Tax=Thermogutta terrifontis TaxID=1331910 RepID=A0A286RJ01_9BACT|nr:hypothetical protein THTE_3332 [Thermogutta terrifontis]